MSDAATTSDKKPAYRVLARKYRPADFTGLIGQEPMVRTLTNAFSTGRIAQAWMLTGVRGVGKTTTARILARALNYKTDEIDAPSVDLTNPGIHCQAILEGRHVDIIEMDAASHTGIEDIKQIIDSVRYAPVSARYKVYIIDEIHMLSDKAFNALLKTLEEPPPHAKFIFATTEIRKVPITVLSRCQRFDLRRVDPADLTAHLASIAGQEGVTAQDDALAMIARAAEGSVRDSLSIFDQAIAHTNGNVDVDSVRAMLGLADRTRIVDLFEQLLGADIASALTTFRGLYDVGADPIVVLNDLADFTHLVTRLRFIKDAADSDVTLSPDERERGKVFAQKLSLPVLARTWQMLLKGIAECEQAARPFAAAEMVLIRLAHAANLPTLDQALQQMDKVLAEAPPRLPSGGGGAGSAQTNISQSSSGAAMAQPDMRGAGDLSGNQPVMHRAQAVGDHGLGEPQPMTQGAIAIDEVPVSSLQSIVDLADKNRDPLFKVNVRRCVRLVSVEPGRLAINLTEDAPANLMGDIANKLTNWTGRKWFVSISRDKGGETLEERDGAKRDAMLASAARDPETAKLLSAFPGARIVDVRVGEDLDAPELATDMMGDDGALYEEPFDPDND